MSLFLLRLRWPELSALFGAEIAGSIRWFAALAEAAVAVARPSLVAGLGARAAR
ncbi:MAG: hypothetical protein HYV63_32305 [Candidatus Schekmanbacteria bacterium]|nr:hypothetical protein [Candidatus Schekmanbacteria bacterium]